MDLDGQGDENPEQVGASRKRTIKVCAEKSSWVFPQVPVPQTNTGRRDEYSQARERTTVKELGKITP